VAAVRNGSAFVVYINGESVASTTAEITVKTLSESFFSGSNSASSPTAFINGYLQDLRITKGVARYTADFTPPLQLYNTYSVSGTITDDTGEPCARTVRLYDRDTGAFIAETTSDASTGAYDFSDMVSDSEVQRIVLDDSAGTLYNDLIDRVIPG
jgi:hypothetical protein